MVIIRVLIGEARFVMEPSLVECLENYSGFISNPVLRAGDASKTCQLSALSNTRTNI